MGEGDGDGDDGGKVGVDGLDTCSSKNSSTPSGAGESQAPVCMGELTGEVDRTMIGENSSCNMLSWGVARVVSGESTGDSIFLLFAARVLLATGGVAVGACAWGRAGFAVEHVDGGAAVALESACWLRFSSHASLLRLFRSFRDLLTCFFFTLVETSPQTPSPSVLESGT